jgi:hypothetical protein
MFTAMALVMSLISAGPAAAQNIIYAGNDAQFGFAASDPTSFQGFTALQERWSNNGCPTVITDVFPAVIPGTVFYATAPTTPFTAAQVAALSAFLSGGGTFLISHDGDFAPAMNQVLTDLGSTLQFGSIQGVGSVNATVVDDSHPLMFGLNNGDSICSFSPGQITGSGAHLVDFPVGTHTISAESVGGGTVVAIADFDIMNNVPVLFFDASCRPNIFQFWDNICTGTISVEETSWGTIKALYR